MGAYLGAKKISAMLGTKVGGGYFQGKEIWSTSLPAGIELYRGNAAFLNQSEAQGFTQAGLIVINQDLALSQSISKLDNGLTLYLATDSVMGTAGNHSLPVIDEVRDVYGNYSWSGDADTTNEYGLTPTVNFSKQDLQSGKWLLYEQTIFNMATVYPVYVKMLDDTHLQFKSVQNGIDVLYSTQFSSRGLGRWVNVGLVKSY